MFLAEGKICAVGSRPGVNGYCGDPHRQPGMRKQVPGCAGGTPSPLIYIVNEDEAFHPGWKRNCRGERDTGLTIGRQVPPGQHAPHRQFQLSRRISREGLSAGRQPTIAPGNRDQERPGHRVHTPHQAICQQVAENPGHLIVPSPVPSHCGPKHSAMLTQVVQETTRRAARTHMIQRPLSADRLDNRPAAGRAGIWAVSQKHVTPSAQPPRPTRWARPPPVADDAATGKGIYQICQDLPSRSQPPPPFLIDHRHTSICGQIPFDGCRPEFLSIQRLSPSPAWIGARTRAPQSRTPGGADLTGGASIRQDPSWPAPRATHARAGERCTGSRLMNRHLL